MGFLVRRLCFLDLGHLREDGIALGVLTSGSMKLEGAAYSRSRNSRQEILNFWQLF
jgi:hypothetical protein